MITIACLYRITDRVQRQGLRGLLELLYISTQGSILIFAPVVLRAGVIGELFGNCGKIRTAVKLGLNFISQLQCILIGPLLTFGIGQADQYVAQCCHCEVTFSRFKFCLHLVVRNFQQHVLIYGKHTHHIRTNLSFGQILLFQ
ncbi:hypothetical protein D3C81_1439970 [compost metagenome]